MEEHLHTLAHPETNTPDHRSGRDLEEANGTVRPTKRRPALSWPFRPLAEFLFGFDYFISYSWSGSEKYALALYRGLQSRGMRCFLDRSPEGFSAGGELKIETARATRYSSALVVIAEPNAFRSRYVPLEVDTFERRRRLIISIDVDDTLARARLDPGFAADLCPTPGAAAMLASLIDKIGPKELAARPEAPSAEVIEKLIQSFRYTRRMARRVQVLGTFTAVFAVVAVLAAVFGVVAKKETENARIEEQQARANATLTTAESANLLTAEGINALRRREPIDALHRFAAAVSATSDLDLTNPSLPESGRTQIRRLDAVNRTRLRLLDQKLPRLTALWEVGTEAVDLRFSPAPGRLVVQTRTGLQLWEVATGRKLAELGRAGKTLENCWFSPDRRTAVAVFKDDPVPAVWETTTGRLVAELQGHEAAIQYVGFDHAGRRAVTCAREIAAYVWDVTTGRRLLALDGHESTVLHAAFSLDDRLIATACREDAARVWDAADGRLLHRFAGHPHGASYVEFSPDGQELLTLPFTWVGQAFYADNSVSEPTFIDGSARVFSRRTDRLRLDLAGHQTGGMHGHLAGSGRVAVSSQQDVGSATDFRLWDLASGKEVFRTSGEDLWRVSRSGEFALTQSDGGAVVVRDTSDGHSRAVLPQVEAILALSDDERWLAARTTDGALTFFCPVIGQTVFRMRGLMGRAAVNFDADGHRFATLTADRTVRIWSLPQPALAELSEPRRVHYTQLDGVGDTVLAVTTEAARLYDTASLRKLADRPVGEEEAAADRDHRVWFPGEPSAHGPASWFTRGGDGAVLGPVLWDRTTGRSLDLPADYFDVSRDGSLVLFQADGDEDSIEAKAEEVDGGSGAEVEPSEKTPALVVRDVATGRVVGSRPVDRVEDAWFGLDPSRVVVVNPLSPYAPQEGLSIRLVDLAGGPDRDRTLGPAPGAGLVLTSAAPSEDGGLILGVVDEPQKDQEEGTSVDLASEVAGRAVLRFWSAGDGLHLGDVPVPAGLVRGVHPSRLGRSPVPGGGTRGGPWDGSRGGSPMHRPTAVDYSRCVSRRRGSGTPTRATSWRSWRPSPA
jgi:WD40 repeat protein